MENRSRRQKRKLTAKKIAKISKPMIFLLSHPVWSSNYDHFIQDGGTVLTFHILCLWTTQNENDCGFVCGRKRLGIVLEMLSDRKIKSFEKNGLECTKMFRRMFPKFIPNYETHSLDVILWTEDWLKGSTDNDSVFIGNASN